MKTLALLSCLTVLVGCSSSSSSGGIGAQSQPLQRRTVASHASRPPAWEPRGVGGGGALYGPTINPHDPNEIFMATDMTDLFHTKDYGLSWETIPFHVAEGGTFTDTQWTSDPSVLFAINADTSGDQLLQKSSDGGTTWTTLSPSTDTIYYLAVDVESPGRLLVTDTSNLYFSNDGGSTFTTIFTDTTGNGLVLGGALFESTDIFVGTSDGFLVSRDDGATFTAGTMAGIPTSESIVSFAGAREGKVTRFFAVSSTGPYAGMTGEDLGSYGGLYRLDDGDAAWSPANAGLTSDDALSFVGMAVNDVDVAYAGGGNLATTTSLAYVTRDGGNSWRSSFNTAGNANVFTDWGGEGGGLGWAFTGEVLGLGVSPTDSDRAVITDLGWVHVTEDGGRTWRAAYSQVQDLTLPGQETPPDKTVVSAGVEQTSVWWMTWSSPTKIFASFTDITSVQSRDGGYSWSRDASNGLTLNTTYQAIRDPRNGYLYAATSAKHDIYETTTTTNYRLDGFDGAIMVSTDDGAHFTTLEDMGHPVIYLAQDPNRPDFLYASVINETVGGIYRKDLSSPSTPAVRLSAPPRTQGHAFNIHVLNDGSLLASYSADRASVGAKRGAYNPYSGVFLSQDGGATWADRTDPAMTYYTKDVVVDPHDARQNTWYATVFNHNGESVSGGVYRTTNRGVSWTKLTPGLSTDVESISIHPHDPNIAYFSTDTNGLYTTSDLTSPMPTFTQVADYPFIQPVRIFWNPYDDNEIWVTSFGSGMKVHHVH